MIKYGGVLLGGIFRNLVQNLVKNLLQNLVQNVVQNLVQNVGQNSAWYFGGIGWWYRWEVLHRGMQLL